MTWAKECCKHTTVLQSNNLQIQIRYKTKNDCQNKNYGSIKSYMNPIECVPGLTDGSQVFYSFLALKIHLELAKKLVSETRQIKLNSCARENSYL